MNKLTIIGICMFLLTLYSALSLTLDTGTTLEATGSNTTFIINTRINISEAIINESFIEIFNLQCLDMGLGQTNYIKLDTPNSYQVSSYYCFEEHAGQTCYGDFNYLVSFIGLFGLIIMVAIVGIGYLLITQKEFNAQMIYSGIALFILVAILIGVALLILSNICI